MSSGKCPCFNYYNSKLISCVDCRNHAKLTGGDIIRNINNPNEVIVANPKENLIFEDKKIKLVERCNYLCVENEKIYPCINKVGRCPGDNHVSFNGFFPKIRITSCEVYIIAPNLHIRNIIHENLCFDLLHIPVLSANVCGKFILEDRKFSICNRRNNHSKHFSLKNYQPYLDKNGDLHVPSDIEDGMLERLIHSQKYGKLIYSKIIFMEKRFLKNYT